MRSRRPKDQRMPPNNCPQIRIAGRGGFSRAGCSACIREEISALPQFEADPLAALRPLSDASSRALGASVSVRVKDALAPQLQADQVADLQGLAIVHCEGDRSAAGGQVDTAIGAVEFDALDLCGEERVMMIG